MHFIVAFCCSIAFVGLDLTFHMKIALPVRNWIYEYPLRYLLLIVRVKLCDSLAAVASAYIIYNCCWKQNIWNMRQFFSLLLLGIKLCTITEILMLVLPPLMTMFRNNVVLSRSLTLMSRNTAWKLKLNSWHWQRRWEVYDRHSRRSDQKWFLSWERSSTSQVWHGPYFEIIL